MTYFVTEFAQLDMFLKDDDECGDSFVLPIFSCKCNFFVIGNDDGM